MFNLLALFEALVVVLTILGGKDSHEACCQKVILNH